MKIITQDGQDYIQIGERAVPFIMDSEGNVVVKPVIEKSVDENGQEKVTVKIPSLKIKLSNNK